MVDQNTTIVIFGATGDLAQRKLVPALFNLDCKGHLPDSLRIVGFSRSSRSDGGFREFMEQAAKEVGGLSTNREEWEKFARRLFFVGGDLNNVEDLLRLKQRLEEMEGGAQPANRLFYLSIAPALYETAVESLSACGIAREEDGWRRVIIEKPFGRDLASAQALNRKVHQTFDERQVYRIDHYLGKETVQNLSVLRFANTIFEPAWNRNYIDSVQITVAEEVGVGDRGGYYDQSGVVRDMVQNHLLQLLTMVAMEPPTAGDPESLRSRKIDVLRAIRRMGPEEAAKHTIRAQYRGYLSEPGVPEGSSTATYTALRLYVDNWRWEGVPFYLRSGKSLAEKATEIAIQFRYPPQVLSSLGECKDLSPNVLGMCLQPDEGIHLRLEAKQPDEGMCMQSVNMEFHYESAFKGQAIPEAYERLLLDALEGDASLFIRSDHVEEAWRIVDPLLKAWEAPSAPPLHLYEQGSWGPDAADALQAQDGRAWLHVCGGHGSAHA